MQKNKSMGYQKVDVCEAYAHSLFDAFETLVDARKYVPWTRDRTISKVVLTEGAGRLLKTPSTIGSGHHAWWADPLNYIPWALVVEGAL